MSPRKVATSTSISSAPPWSGQVAQQHRVREAEARSRRRPSTVTAIETVIRSWDCRAAAKANSGREERRRRPAGSGRRCRSGRRSSSPPTVEVGGQHQRPRCWPPSGRTRAARGSRGTIIASGEDQLRRCATIAIAKTIHGIATTTRDVRLRAVDREAEPPRRLAPARPRRSGSTRLGQLVAGSRGSSSGSTGASSGSSGASVPALRGRTGTRAGRGRRAASLLGPEAPLALLVAPRARPRTPRGVKSGQSSSRKTNSE